MIPTKRLCIIRIGDGVRSEITSDSATIVGHGLGKLYRGKKTVANDDGVSVRMTPSDKSTAVSRVVSSLQFAIEDTSLNSRTFGNTYQSTAGGITAFT